MRDCSLCNGLMASCFEARWLIAFLRSSYFQAKILLIRIFLSVKERLRLYVSPLPLVSVSWRFNPNGFERCNLWLHITIEILNMASISPLTSKKCPWTTRIYPPNDLMLTHGLNKEYTMYDKLIKCPRPSVTCKKVELRACDFLLEKCVIDLSRGATWNSESTDKTFLSVNISIMITDNKPYNYMLPFVLWSDS